MLLVDSISQSRQRAADTGREGGALPAFASCRVAAKSCTAVCRGEKAEPTGKDRDLVPPCLRVFWGKALAVVPPTGVGGNRSWTAWRCGMPYFIRVCGQQQGMSPNGAKACVVPGEVSLWYPGKRPHPPHFQNYVLTISTPHPYSEGFFSVSHALQTKWCYLSTC